MMVNRTKWHLHPGVRTGSSLTFGERAADKVRNGMGSWPFVVCFLGFMGVWAVANTAFSLGRSGGFDPYPYILLNLGLSMVAGLQGAILLIAAKRADQVSSEVAIHTLNNTSMMQTMLTRNNELTESIAKLTGVVEEHIASSAPDPPPR